VLNVPKSILLESDSSNFSEHGAIIEMTVIESFFVEKAELHQLIKPIHSKS
jgi:hypothetical protein